MSDERDEQSKRCRFCKQTRSSVAPAHLCPHVIWWIWGRKPEALKELLAEIEGRGPTEIIKTIWGQRDS